MRNIIALLGLTFLSIPALANEASGGGYGAIAAALAISIAAFGGALGQGKAAAAALEGIARNPAAEKKFHFLWASH